MNEQGRIADLTVEELKSLIRQIVQEAVAEVMVEFSIAAERDAELTFQAEVAELLRSSLNDGLPGALSPIGNIPRFDD